VRTGSAAETIPDVRRFVPNRGFTLVEVLVALAIIAIALTAAVRATGVSVDSSAQVKERMFASWVAQNRLAVLTASHAFPDIGTRTGSEIQAGRSYTWEESTGATPNTDFRRVEIRVRAAGQEHVAATLVGYLAAIHEQ
jgi:general secretion pathway protein I